MRKILFVLLSCVLFAQDDAALSKAKALLGRVPLVDGHNDLPWSIREAPGKACMDLEAWDLRKPCPLETDLARLKQGKLAAQFWSVYVPPEPKEGWARTQLEQMDLARRMIARYPEAMTFATRSTDILSAKKAGKVAGFLGIEGGHVIENSLGALRAYYDLGARYMTLTHNLTLDWADSALDEARHGGLTDFGKEVVREMNRLGMLVDLSHVSDGVMTHALDVSQAPVIFSHSSARALVDHPRNVPDVILKRMKANGGVVMVTYVPTFVNAAKAAWSKELDAQLHRAPKEQHKALREAHIKAHGPSPKATLKDVADHIEHVAKVAGVDHVGIGSDFCGILMPEGLEDVASFPNLFAELIRRGWKDADLAKLAGRNLIRAFGQAEAVAKRLQKERPASLATLAAFPPAVPPQKRLGIFGGMGPEATANLYQLIVQLTPAKRDQDHIPTLMYSYPQVPDRTTAIKAQDPAIVPFLVEGVTRLEKAGASFIVIPCNTAHYYFDDMQKAVKIPILHMIKEVVAEVPRLHPKARKVGLLATSGTLDTGLYEKELRARGLEVVKPRGEIQSACVMKAVYSIKAGGDRQQCEDLLFQAGEDVVAQGADVIVLGCTEIPLAFNPQRVKIPVVNANRVLAQRAIERFQKLP